MPEHGPGEWKRLIRERSSASGEALPEDVLDELASHVADAYDAESQHGGSEQEAVSAATRLIDSGAYADVAMPGSRRAAGSRLLSRARTRLGSVWLDAAFDVRYAFRSMRRQRLFSVILIAILGVGIGAATSAYTVIASVLFEALPYPAADQLIVLRHGRPPDESASFSPADWLDYDRQRHSLVGLAAYASWPMNMTGAGEPERLRSVIVSGRFFDVIGVSAVLGRTTTERDDHPSSPAVVVLSDGFWRRRFGATPEIIGRAVTINGKEATVVGVMPSWFALPGSDVDLWMPMGLSPEASSDRSGEWLSLIGRLRPGVPLDKVRSDLSLTAARLAAAYPRPNRDTHVEPYRLLDAVVGAARRALWLGGLAGVFVLLAGIANATNLILARATVRRDEIAVRTALGAEPMRLARQLLVESAVFAVLGGALGSALSWTMLRALALLADDRLPRANNLTVGGHALMVATAASLLSAAVAGGAAAWLLVRSGTQAGLRTSPQRVVRQAPMQGVLLATQIAFAIMLITGAALVVRGYVATLRINPGFDATDTTTMQLTLPRAAYGGNAAQIRFAERALDAVRALPGVIAAGVVSDLPFVGNATHFPVTREGDPSASARMATVRLADPGFFQTLHVPLIAGRCIEALDRSDGVAVAVLNRSASERYGGSGAIGQRLQISGEGSRTIVGIVGDIKHAGLHADEGPVIYVPYAQKSFDFLNWMGIVVRASSAPSERSLKTAIARVDPNQPVEAVRSMADYLARESAPYRFSSLVVASMAGTTLMLALAGIHGLTMFMVNRRSRELAIRMALGATRGSIVWMVLRQIGVLVVFGTAAGIVGSLTLKRVLVAVIPGSSSASQYASAASISCALIGVAAVLAAAGPAFRGARLDPKATLQAE